MELQIGKHLIGKDHPTYFIADIAANHDGSLERALELIPLQPRLARMQPSSKTSADRRSFLITVSAI